MIDHGSDLTRTQVSVLTFVTDIDVFIIPRFDRKQAGELSSDSEACRH